MPDVKVGDSTITVSNFNGRRGVWAMRIMRSALKRAPEVMEAVDEAVKAYEKTNTVVFSRAQALYQFPPTTVYGEAAESLGVPDGTVIPGRVGHLTEADWEASGGVLELPRAAPFEVKLGAGFPLALDLAEDEMLRLIGLAAMSDSQFAAMVRNSPSKDETLKELQKRGDDLIDAPMTDLLNLVLTVVETTQAQIDEAMRELSPKARLGKLAETLGLSRLFGSWLKGSVTPDTVTPTSQPEPKDEGTPTPPDDETDGSGSTSSPSPTSSSDAPTPSDGTSEPPSTEPASSSSAVSSAA